jgi:predicted dehydrogenase
MGRRRVRCLQAHGVSSDNIRVFDQREDRRLESKSKYGVDGFANFEEGWAWNPDVLIISLPSKLHMQYCLIAARAQKDFWCEIALSDSLEGTDELLSLAKEHQLIGALGINHPFHFLMQQAKVWLHEEPFGKSLTYSIAHGNYLPNWHPWEDYRDFYDETQIMGVISQELGTLYSLLDTQISEIYGQLQKTGSLDIPSLDNVQLLARTKDGTSVTFQIDLMQDKQHHEYRVVSDSGVIEIGFQPKPFVRRYLNATKQHEIVDPPEGYEFEQCYIDEFGAFLDALENRTAWYHSLDDGVQILHCLQALEESNRTGHKVNLSNQ